jgi:hypothetical protein
MRESKKGKKGVEFKEKQEKKTENADKEYCRNDSSGGK